MIKTGILRSGAIGDLISLTPAIRQYAEKHPEEELTLICGESYAHVLENNPHISKIIPFNDHIFYHGNLLSKLSEIIKTALRMSNLDKCFIMHEDIRWELLADIAGIKQKVTLQPEGNRYERAQRCMNTSGDNRPEYYPVNTCLFDLPKEYICIAAGGGRNSKQDTPQRRWQGYKELISKIDYNIVLIGNENDSPKSLQKNVLDLCGMISLDDCYHIIRRAELFIGNDSGLLHLAECTNTKTIGIFTATDPAIVLPPDTNTVSIRSSLSCSPCEKSGNIRTDCNAECIKSTEIAKQISAYLKL